MRNIEIGQIAKILGIVNQSKERISGYHIDSRLIGPGELFFALKGEKVEGSRYLKQVSAQGAKAAIVPLSYQGPDYGLILLRVEDVFAALQGLAKELMKGCSSKIIAITGSVGKTTTKEFIAALLSSKYLVGKTENNYNSQRTYPITLLNRTGDEEVLVLELGMSEPGEMKRLVNLAPIDIAVLTKVAFVHIGNFPRGMVELAENKAEIFTHPRTDLAIFDHSVYDYPQAIEKIHSKRLSFSISDQKADLFLTEDFFVDEKGVRAYQFDPPYKQAHLLHNFLAAVTVARAMKLSWDEINQQLGSLELPKMRFEQIEIDGVLFINDAYNANPDSMKAALSGMPEPKEGGKRIAVLGMMADMGKEHENAHRSVGQYAIKSLDHLLVLGREAKGVYDAFQEAKKPAEHYVDFKALTRRLKTLMRPGDVVLVKASRSVELEKLFDEIGAC